MIEFSNLVASYLLRGLLYPGLGFVLLLSPLLLLRRKEAAASSPPATSLVGLAAACLLLALLPLPFADLDLPGFGVVLGNIGAEGLLTLLLLPLANLSLLQEPEHGRDWLLAYAAALPGLLAGQLLRAADLSKLLVLLASLPLLLATAAAWQRYGGGAAGWLTMLARHAAWLATSTLVLSSLLLQLDLTRPLIGVIIVGTSLWGAVSSTLIGRISPIQRKLMYWLALLAGLVALILISVTSTLATCVRPQRCE